MASNAEKLFQKLQRRGKCTDLSIGDVEVLLSHELLAGLVESGGKHLYVVKVPYRQYRQFAKTIADTLGSTKVESYIMKDGFNVPCHGNHVSASVVTDIVEFIEVRHRMKVLEDGGN